MSIKKAKRNARSIYQIKYVTCAKVLQDLNSFKHRVKTYFVQETEIQRTRYFHLLTQHPLPLMTSLLLKKNFLLNINYLIINICRVFFSMLLEISDCNWTFTQIKRTFLKSESPVMRNRSGNKDLNMLFFCYCLCDQKEQRH